MRRLGRFPFLPTTSSLRTKNRWLFPRSRFFLIFFSFFRPIHSTEQDCASPLLRMARVLPLDRGRWRWKTPSFSISSPSRSRRLLPTFSPFAHAFRDEILAASPKPECMGETALSLLRVPLLSARVVERRLPGVYPIGFSFFTTCVRLQRLLPPEEGIPRPRRAAPEG